MQNKGRKQLEGILFPVLSIIVALVLGAVIMAVMGYNVSNAYLSLLKGAFGNKNSVGETLIQATPLIFTALSYAIALRCGLVNLGAEGQLYIGGICGAIVGAHLTGIPGPIHIILVLAAGFLGGALWGLIVGILKVKFNASELITTIMLNYIALELVSYCVTNAPFKDMTPGAAPRMAAVADSVKLPIIMSQSRLHLGFLFALIGIVFYYIFMWRTTKGYEMRVIGQNPNAGRYSGMNIKTNGILSIFIAGGFAGLGGIINIIGVNYYLAEGFGGNYGFSGIAVALLGSCTPIGILISSILFGALNAGGIKMQLLAGVPSAAIYMIQGMIIIFAVSKELFLWFRKFAPKSKEKKEVKADG